MDAASPLVAGIEWVHNGVFLLVFLWVIRQWLSGRDERTGWLTATFGAIAIAVVVGQITREIEPSVRPDIVTKALLVVVLPFPYYLLRFLGTFEPVPRWLTRFVGLGIVVLTAIGIAVPRLLDADAAVSVTGRAYGLALVGVWVLALTAVAVRFWRAGYGQPTLARRRLRTLSLASASLSLGLVLAGAELGVGAELAVQVMSLVSAALFLLGFAPPSALKGYWRQREQLLLNQASMYLMAARTPQEVADLLVPHIRDVIAARGVAVFHDGVVISAAGTNEDDLDTLRTGGPTSSVVLPLAHGAVHVWTNAYTPFFGQQEQQLMARLALLADLALDRTLLFSREQEAKVELEAANKEIESFLYSASHDLKSPLIALQSYVDVLTAQYSDVFDDEGRWFLSRMRSNCTYMASLVGDLLELSRVGRIETVTTRVDLGALALDVAIEAQQQRPTVVVDVAPLPVVALNAVRARQLLRNLIENAAQHSRSDAVRIELRSEPSTTTPGGVVLYLRDDGVGVPAAYRERVFDVFEQLEAPVEGSQGTGIGLSVCRKIAESTGGRIWITDYDGGAEFAILFPPDVVVATFGPADSRSEVDA
jgi:signal transduction histidine kinase